MQLAAILPDFLPVSLTQILPQLPSVPPNLLTVSSELPPISANLSAILIEFVAIAADFRRQGTPVRTGSRTADRTWGIVVAIAPREILFEIPSVSLEFPPIFPALLPIGSQSLSVFVELLEISSTPLLAFLANLMDLLGQRFGFIELAGLHRLSALGLERRHLLAERLLVLLDLRAILFDLCLISANPLLIFLKLLAILLNGLMVFFDVASVLRPIGWGRGLGHRGVRRGA